MNKEQNIYDDHNLDPNEHHNDFFKSPEENEADRIEFYVKKAKESAQIAEAARTNAADRLEFRPEPTAAVWIHLKESIKPVEAVDKSEWLTEEETILFKAELREEERIRRENEGPDPFAEPIKEPSAVTHTDASSTESSSSEANTEKLVVFPDEENYNPIRAKAEGKELIEARSIEEALKPAGRCVGNNFTKLKTTPDKFFTQKYYAEIDLERHDLFYNPDIGLGRKTKEGIVKIQKLMPIENKIFKELTKDSKRITKAQQKKDVISSILANLLILQKYSDYLCIDMKKDVLSKSKDKKAGIPINKNSIHLENKPISETFIQIIKLMAEMKLIESTTGYRSLKNEVGNKTRVKPIGELKEMIDQLQDKRLSEMIFHHDNELIKLQEQFEFKNKSIAGFVDYEKSSFTKLKTNQLKGVNELNYKSIFTLKDSEILFSPETQIFSNNFESGGRYQGDMLNIISSKDAKIFIDGEQTVKIDVQCSIINIFYYLAGIAPTQRGDLYRLNKVQLEKVGINTDSFKDDHFNLVRDVCRTIIHECLKGGAADLYKNLGKIFTKGKANPNGAKFYKGLADISKQTNVQNDKSPLKCVPLLIKAMQEKNPAVFADHKVNYGKILFTMYEIIGVIRTELVNLTEQKQKRQRDYSNKDNNDYFSQKKNAYSHFSMYDSIYCKAIHQREVAEVIKEHFSDFYKIDVDLNIYVGVTKEEEYSHRNLYWKIKGKPHKSNKPSKRDLANGKRQAIRDLGVNYFDGLLFDESIAHRELVQAIMDETGFKDAKSRRIIKEFLDSGFLVAGGIQRKRFYTISDNAIEEGYEKYDPEKEKFFNGINF